MVGFLVQRAAYSGGASRRQHVTMWGLFPGLHSCALFYCSNHKPHHPVHHPCRTRPLVSSVTPRLYHWYLCLPNQRVTGSSSIRHLRHTRQRPGCAGVRSECGLVGAHACSSLVLLVCRLTCCYRASTICPDRRIHQIRWRCWSIRLSGIHLIHLSFCPRYKHIPDHESFNE